MSGVSKQSRRLLLAALNMQTILARYPITALVPAMRSLISMSWIPLPMKWIFVILLIINARSLPLVWHYRVFQPFVVTAWRKRQIADKRKKVEAFSRVDSHPFEVEVGGKHWATIDDCDWNGHLSNSSYSKNLDFARTRMLSQFFDTFHVDGGHIPLGGTYFSFLREIPALSEYEVRMTIGGWDNKWIYTIGYFISYPKAKKDTKGVTPAASEAVTPIPLLPQTKPLPEGAVLHCISISQQCFKHGRITVPPEVALATAGYGTDSKTRWERSQSLRFGEGKQDLEGKTKTGEAMAAFLRGGWKEEPWWKLEDEILAVNERRMASLGKLRETMLTWGQ